MSDKKPVRYVTYMTSRIARAQNAIDTGIMNAVGKALEQRFAAAIGFPQIEPESTNYELFLRLKARFLRLLQEKAGATDDEIAAIDAVLTTEAGKAEMALLYDLGLLNDWRAIKIRLLAAAKR